MKVLLGISNRHVHLNEEDYKTLIELCNENEVYILDSSQNLEFNYENVLIMNFYEQLLNHILKQFL